MQRLFELGARRVLVTGTGPMGCVPAELAQRSRTGECAVELQRAAALFNPQLDQMVSGVNNEIGGQVFIAANTMRMNTDFISNPAAYGMQFITLYCFHEFYVSFRSDPMDCGHTQGAAQIWI